MIQAVALAEFDGLNAPNAYGHRAARRQRSDDDRHVRDGPANDYWDHVDFVVDAPRARASTWRCCRRGATTGTNRRAASRRSSRPRMRRRTARGSAAVRDATNIIWIVGGDRAVENDTHRAIIRNMARGLRAGRRRTAPDHVPSARRQQLHRYFHDEPWLDFNMRQNGHGRRVITGRYDKTRADYDRLPTKPVLDGEPVYEDHPSHSTPRTRSLDFERCAPRGVWDLFTGAFGHTYGHHSVWQMWMRPVARR